MLTSHVAEHDLLPRFDAASARTGTITAQFHAFDREHPHVYSVLEELTAERLAAGATRIGLKALFEALRWRLPEGVGGLNNNFTALYARKLIADHPHWAFAFELRRRRSL
ncbi:hypothetical protein AQI95_29075 [Streptomyces yokosukanensis]|uniref:Uncharacterized protein n=1 Tax=Streptomyces yokosukanensis TaxID=67386 RepID=A0A117Q0F8_9ACTN|nr:hypothetical protein [Streptomyces yokosukanensis]KUN02126.1 hypothetical protein AQI95_29075 [Streptomyces yokosukanensis]